MPNEDKQLHKTELATDGAVASLGVLAIAHLVKYGVVSFFFDAEGYVTIAGQGEVTLDALPEEMALQELMARGYNNEALVEYLKSRDARMGRV